MKKTGNFNVDFFLIGAAKCGSTWLAYCLDEHPQITISNPKEPHFFVKKLSVFGERYNKNYLKDWNWYKNCFKHAQPNTKLIDCSINLFFNIPDAPVNIKKYFPNAKFLIILRDPVKRTYSHWIHEKFKDKNINAPDSFEEAIKNKELIFRSCYYAQLKEWLNYFPLKRFFIILDIDITNNNVIKTWRKLCHFLEINSDFIPSKLYTKINVASKRTLLYDILISIGHFARKMGLSSLVDYINYDLRLGQFIDNKIGIKKIQYPELERSIAKTLYNQLESDIEKLEKLINRDLSEWKKYKQ